MDEIIRIQKDSIVMTQAELKELQQKLQEKVCLNSFLFCFAKFYDINRVLII